MSPVVATGSAVVVGDETCDYCYYCCSSVDPFSRMKTVVAAVAVDVLIRTKKRQMKMQVRKWLL